MPRPRRLLCRSSMSTRRRSTVVRAGHNVRSFWAPTAVSPTSLRQEEDEEEEGAYPRRFRLVRWTTMSSSPVMVVAKASFQRRSTSSSATILRNALVTRRTGVSAKASTRIRRELETFDRTKSERSCGSQIPRSVSSTSRERSRSRDPKYVSAPSSTVKALRPRRSTQSGRCTFAIPSLA